MKYQGIWIPVVTPMKNDEIDFNSLRKLIDYYISKGATGIVPMGTTGESPTMCENEYQQVLEKTMEFVNNRVPVLAGLGNNNTKKLLKDLRIVENLKVSGILSVSPYYNRPDQRGIYEHFKRMAESTCLDIIVYNIPYRTGRNIELDTIYRLAEIPNIAGIKDCNGEMKQTTELLLNPPKDFTVLTGEDALFFTTLVHGGHGGILASAHLGTEKYIDVFNKIKSNDLAGALKVWKECVELIPLIFEEPNPTPIKYCLQQMGLIESDEARLPLLTITDKLKGKLAPYIEKLK